MFRTWEKSINLVKKIDNSFSVIGMILNSCRSKKKINVYYKGSLYNLNDIKRISKYKKIIILNLFL